ncbi:MAG TPA: hypothetical protein VLL69_05050, partial [Streptosporangiaceae bacterium]|nr:hypothetical protein [Streptosporangiaceae bacterium]
MTIGTPAPAGLALASYERPVGVNPPLNYPAYRSTALRAPRQPLKVMPHGLTEVTGPLLAAGGLVLPSYQRPVGVHPPLANPSYRSTLLRSPK